MSDRGYSVATYDELTAAERASARLSRSGIVTEVRRRDHGDFHVVVREEQWLDAHSILDSVGWRLSMERVGQPSLRERIFNVEGLGVALAVLGGLEFLVMIGLIIGVLLFGLQLTSFATGVLVGIVVGLVTIGIPVLIGVRQGPSWDGRRRTAQTPPSRFRRM